MTTKFRWRGLCETDAGVGVYTMPNGKEIEVQMPNFSVAFALHNELHDAFTHARQDARAGLLAEISRIEP